MDVSFGLADFAQLVPHSIVIRTDRVIVSVGSGFTIDRYLKNNSKICDLFDYFDITDFNYEGEILEGREYILWQKGQDQIIKGSFYKLPHRDLIVFIGRVNDSSYDSFNLSALLYCREVERKIVQVYGNTVDINRFFREITSSKDIDHHVNIDDIYGITFSNYTGKIAWCNEAFLDMSEREREQVIGVRPRDAIYGKRSAYIDSDYVDSMVAKGKPFYFENLASSALGRQFWFGATVFPIFNSWGENIGRVHFVKDISDRKIKDIVVEENESLLQLCIQAAGIGLWSVDIQTCGITVNRQFKQLLGLADDTDITSDKLSALLTNDDQQHLRTCILQLQEAEPYCNLSQISVVRDEQERFFNLNAYCIKFDTKGKPVRVVGTITDVTEEKNREQKIVAQKEFYETILNELPADIAIFSMERKYKFVNKNAIKSPAVREWIIDKDDFDYCREKGVDIKQAEKRRDYFYKMMATGEGLRFVEGNPDTGKHLLRIYYPIKNERNEITLVIGYGIDISEQIRAIETEKQLNEHKNQFIRITSHELRTPLTIIYSNAELLQMFCNCHTSNENEQSYIERILKEVNSMIDILNELMLVSRMEKNGIELNIEPTDVGDYASELAEPFSPYKDGRMLSLVIEGNVDMWNLDGRLLKYAITNLLVNAFKYSPGARPPKLHIFTRKGYLILEITDHGMGIPSKEIKNVFKSFFRGSNVGAIQGTGIGLMIVKYAVDKHNGLIEIQSEEGRGTTITIAIPE